MKYTNKIYLCFQRKIVYIFSLYNLWKSHKAHCFIQLCNLKALNVYEDLSGAKKSNSESGKEKKFNLSLLQKCTNKKQGAHFINIFNELDAISYLLIAAITTVSVFFYFKMNLWMFLHQIYSIFKYTTKNIILFSKENNLCFHFIWSMKTK